MCASFPRPGISTGAILPRKKNHPPEKTRGVADHARIRRGLAPRRLDSDYCQNCGLKNSVFGAQVSPDLVPLDTRLVVTLAAGV